MNTVENRMTLMETQLQQIRDNLPLLTEGPFFLRNPNHHRLPAVLYTRLSTDTILPERRGPEGVYTVYCPRDTNLLANGFTHVPTGLRIYIPDGVTLHTFIPSDRPGRIWPANQQFVGHEQYNNELGATDLRILMRNTTGNDVLFERGRPLAYIYALWTELE